MLNLKFLKIFLNSFFFVFLLSAGATAKNEFYKCPEKVTNIIKNEGQFIKSGEILGVNYVKFNGLDTPFTKITIKFKELGSKKKARKIITNESLIKNSLGYEVYKKTSEGNLKIENTFNFINLKKTYAFTRKEFYWSFEDQSQSKKNYEYESSGRCIKIKKDEYDLEKILKVAKKEKKEKKITKKKSSFPKTLIGERSFAMSWNGYDDLILGKIKFIEKDLVGKLEFLLPNDDGDCIGTYVLSKTKGTWSFYCEKRNVNASGFLEWNSLDGSVKGDGKDNKGNKLKFKVASIN